MFGTETMKEQRFHHFGSTLLLDYVNENKLVWLMIDMVGIGGDQMSHLIFHHKKNKSPILLNSNNK